MCRKLISAQDSRTDAELLSTWTQNAEAALEHLQCLRADAFSHASDADRYSLDRAQKLGKKINLTSKKNANGTSEMITFFTECDENISTAREAFQSAKDSIQDKIPYGLRILKAKLESLAHTDWPSSAFEEWDKTADKIQFEMYMVMKDSVKCGNDIRAHITHMNSKIAGSRKG